MQSIFITGIPTAGKSHLSRRLVVESEYTLFDVDTLRETMRNNLELRPWVDFFFSLDEKQYYQTASCELQWQNLVNQSEAFWPTVKKDIFSRIGKGNYIIEGVNLLPHLVSELHINGVVLLGESYEKTLERNKESPRWGDTEELQIMEAKAFFFCEREQYRREADKYGIKWFEDNEEAYEYLKKLVAE